MYINPIANRAILCVLCLFLYSTHVKGQANMEDLFDLDFGSNSIYYKHYAGKLDSVFYLPDSVCVNGRCMPIKAIDLGAFIKRDELKEVILPRTLEVIGSEAFSECKSLEFIRIPPKVNQIDADAFAMANLRSVEVAKDNPFYDSRFNCNAVIETNTNSLIVGTSSTVIPNSVTRIGKYAFSGRQGLERIYIPKNVLAIEDHAFNRCVNLKDSFKTNTSQDGCIRGVESIGVLSFYGCAMESISLPKTLKVISHWAFSECTNLQAIFIPANVDSIGVSILSHCSNLESVTVDSRNINYDSRNNCNAIIESKSNKLIAGCKNSTVPKSVRIIGRGAFAGQDGIKHMVLPDGIVEIEEGAFNACKNLESIVLPESIRELGDYFGGCNKLKRIIVHSKTPPNHAFDQSMDYQNITLCVPKGYVKRYRESGWDMFKNICEIER